ncbi:hypothetical protein GCM10010205_16620 [Streptomyces nojiriensis]|nr:hypothetical protein JYK04_03813 [Streptomyces nojiriensis]GGR88852.1 hypothetical protein GCM10010205_16620 [Streptomyces nojiriensis]
MVLTYHVHDLGLLTDWQRRSACTEPSRIEESADILKEGLASICTAMTDMADGHIENDALVGAMFRKVAPAPHEGSDGPGYQR